MSLYTARQLALGQDDPNIELINGDTRDDRAEYTFGMFPTVVRKVEALEQNARTTQNLPLDLQKAQADIASLKVEVERLKLFAHKRGVVSTLSGNKGV